jgi:hypothetical protein
MSTQGDPVLASSIAPLSGADSLQHAIIASPFAEDRTWKLSDEQIDADRLAGVAIIKEQIW